MPNFTKLAEYNAEIGRVLAEYRANPTELVASPLGSKWTRAEDARTKLRQISGDIRLKAWDVPALAKATADKADAAASDIEKAHDLRPTNPLTRPNFHSSGQSA